MLFNSYTFIFAFLPITVLGFLIARRWSSQRATMSWLVICSIFFYGFWNPLNLVIMVPSIALNYGLATLIRRHRLRGNDGERIADLIVALGVVANLSFLGYFKYKNFFLGSLNYLAGTDLELVAVILPLGISFITFQKIAFLVDVRSGVVDEFDAVDFLTFVFFFPQLIAGPIVHYREMMPQFKQVGRELTANDWVVGLSLFSMGLFKKVVLADGIAPYVSPTFNGAAHGETITFVTAWMAALGYTFQIYFDFSGYSDMAIGAARLFGIRLPFNFNSPLKASSIIDFWSRWHVTLTRFLTAYVYTPLVMRLTRARMASGKPVLTRKRPSREAFLVLVAGPTLLTMLLSGLWHGAGVTFLVWGALHGAFLVINHAWRQWRPAFDAVIYERCMKPIGFIVTFVSVVVAMVFFRAPTMESASRVLRGMVGVDGVSLPLAVVDRLGAVGQWLVHIGVTTDFGSGQVLISSAVWLIVLFLIATRMPNSLELLRHLSPALHFDAPRPLSGRRAAPVAPVPAAASAPLALGFGLRWATLMAGLFVAGSMGLNRISEFLYWQF